MNIQEEIKDDPLETVMELVFRAGFLKGSGLSFVEDEGRSYKLAKEKLANLIAIKELEARIEELKNVYCTIYEDIATSLGNKPDNILYNTADNRITDLEQQLLKLKENK